ncbi:MAG: glycosyltransferase family 2 protein [Candidatus Eisenbacteria bacterium]|nr:glycosyltransferase family 2 protein [Candidatus Eisenbacteria bacterium]
MLSIIIPTYNSSRTLVKLLRSIRGSGFDDCEILVVDDLSTDDTVEAIRPFGVRYFRMPRNGGPSAARNLGAREARGDVLLFLDADVVVWSDTLERTARFFREHPERSVMIGVYDPEPANRGAWPLYKALQCYSYYRSFPEVRRVTLLWAAVAAFRRDLYLESGGFDDRYDLPCMEDLELGRRISKRTPIYLNRAVRVRHHFPVTLRKNVKDHFTRGSLWVEIWFTHRIFDDYLSTPRRAVGRLAATAAVVALPFAALAPHALVLTGAGLAVYLACNHDLWRTVAEKRPLFLPAAFGMDFLLGLVLGAAAFHVFARESLRRLRAVFRGPAAAIEPFGPDADAEPASYPYGDD